MTHTPKIEGAITNAIEALNKSKEYWEWVNECTEYADKDIAYYRKTIKDLQAFVDALPDDLDVWASSLKHERYDVEGYTAKLTEMAVRDE